jgi:hypothetical protein
VRAPTLYLWNKALQDAIPFGKAFAWCISLFRHPQLFVLPEISADLDTLAVLPQSQLHNQIVIVPDGTTELALRFWTVNRPNRIPFMSLMAGNL